MRRGIDAVTADAPKSKDAGAAACFEPGRGEVIHLNSNVVGGAFAKGTSLVENSLFQIHASRRADPGVAELHAHETDIFYVLQGEAELVTGGTMVNRTDIRPGQTRGDAIVGGDVVTLRPGDIIIIPAGTPHWFRQIKTAPFLYYTVKAIER